MSTSSEIVDSARFSGQKTLARYPEKSNFSQTFNLLNQYLKENGTLGDLSLGITTSATAAMNLFPVAEKFPKKQPESAQMTIFYAGKVIVLDDFPADKAMEIMMLAGKGTSQKPQTFQPASDWIPKPAEASDLVASEHKNIPKPVVSDLPIARKASLTRFLEKRKERITARAPYHGENHGSKQDDEKAWLGLAAAAQSRVQS